ncbi:hypothetical protein BCR32DRAFT_131785 [Anaeromyces robustus]|uniref:Uncharacterized protein n=1 Tax=Anaeromyces robustus TaxID=1754192 RepID=A0A1Y1XEV5_9FUNG|nr:hypothetical protein BCR32DRAFT_131785 [Anaeromyces robustus]|eukprot:ORX84300.1 hypothetical protein BCR32DRAFT_131785 [Anaeromyces robustus]
MDYKNETLINNYLFNYGESNYLLNNNTTEIPFYENYHEKESLYRFHPNSATCYGKEYTNVIMGVSGQFHDSDCYTFIIQFIIVSLMYINVGRGKYWLLLFLASLAGIFGAFVENTTLGFICQVKTRNTSYNNVFSFLLNEIFWITNEYSVPLLNLIKMQAFSEVKLTKYITYIIFLLALPFMVFRFLIGYNRMTRGYLLDSDIRAYHSGAFGVMAAADILCTITILYFSRKTNNDILQGQASNIKHHVKRSSYTILIIVDIVSFVLCVLELIADTGPLKDKISTQFVVPFHCLKNSFALILATDAVIFKYGVNSEYAGYGSSGHGAHGNRSGSYGYQLNSGRKYSNHSYDITYTNDTTYPSLPNMSSSSLNVMGNGNGKSYNTNNNSPTNATNNNYNNYNNYGNNGKSGNEPMANVTPYNYPTFDMDMYAKSSNKNKTIIKNFTNIKTQTIVEDLSNHQKRDIDYQPNQTFGFLNK